MSPWGSGFQRMLLEQTAHLSEELISASNDVEEMIHEVRKRCKRVRAIVRLLRPHAKPLYRQENATFRDIAQRFSSFRDTDVRLETFDELVGPDESERFAPLRDLLVRRRDTGLLQEQVSLTAREVIEVRERLKRADIPNESFKLIGPGLRFCYGRGRRAMSKAYKKQEETAFHEWRKRVKDLGYQMQILRELWPPMLKRLRTELDELGDLLGKEHDLTVLGETISKQADDQVRKQDLQRFLELTETRKLKLQTEAQAAGQRLYAEKPGNFMRRIEAYWETWQREAPAPAEETG